jgi:hypothetical protein
MRTHSIALALASALYLAAAARATPQSLAPGCEPRWLPAFGGMPGSDLAIRTATVHDDGSGPALYVGGQFSSFGSVQGTACIARFDGLRVSAVGVGLSSMVNRVMAFAAFDDGTGSALYAGGGVGPLGSPPNVALARWDGSSWTSLLGGSDSGAILALAEFDDGSGRALFVGGTFTSIAGVPASGMAKWDGAVWSEVGGGASNFVEALHVFDDGTGPALYAGGPFTSIGGVAADRVARWNGASWSPVGAGVGPLGNRQGHSVRCMATFDDGAGPALYVGGEFTNSAGTQVRRVAKWTGSAWAPLAAGMNGGVNAMLAFDDGAGPRLFLGGTFQTADGLPAQRIAAWNGASFAPLGDGVQITATSGEVTALAHLDSGSGPKLYAVGSFISAGGVAVANIARWDGAAWASIGTPGLPSAARGVIAHDDGSGPALFVATISTSIGSVAVSHVAKWNGTSWSSLQGGVNGFVRAMEVFDGGAGPELYVAGEFSLAGGAAANNIARWDGAHWHALGSGVDGPVYALKTHDDGSGPQLFVGGRFASAGGVDVQSVARWDGAGWIDIPGATQTGSIGYPTQLGEVRAFAIHGQGAGSRLIAGGTFTCLQNGYAKFCAGGVPAAGVALWNGARWRRLGYGLNSTVMCLESFAVGGVPRLFAGGAFTMSGPNAVARIAQFDGVSWSPLAGGVEGSFVNSLRRMLSGDGDWLYVGGAFSIAGGLPNTESLARWSGSSWEAVGGGIDDPSLFFPSVLALDVVDDGGEPVLYVSGTIPVSPSGDSHLLKFGCDAPLSGLVYCTAGITSNGCVPAIRGLGVASATAGSGFEIEISGVDGQRSGLIFYGVSGPVATPWSAQSTSMRCVGSPTQRMSAKTSGGTNGACDGTFREDWNAFRSARPAALGQPFAGGEMVWAQGWFRDPPAPKATALTGGLMFSVSP